MVGIIKTIIICATVIVVAGLEYKSTKKGA